jgi:signal transduction histidine kinase
MRQWIFIVYCLLQTTTLRGQIAIAKIIINGKAKPPTNQPIRLKALDDDLTIELKKNTWDSLTYNIQKTSNDNEFFKTNNKNASISSIYPVVKYNNLEGGDYEITIQTFKNNAIADSLKIPIKVQQTLFEESWFMPTALFYLALLGIAGVYFFLLYNFRQKLKIQNIRNRIAADLHDEVGATLSSIVISTKLIEKRLSIDPTTIQPILDTIKNNSKETIQSIRDTVWALNPDNDSIEQLIEKMKAFGYQILTAKDIAFGFANHINLDKVPKITMEQRRNVYLIFKEAINNIAKHSEATTVLVSLSAQKEGIELVISDNGKGFDTTESHAGNGLKNYQTRAAQNLLLFTLKSEIDKGTQIRVVIPEI